MLLLLACTGPGPKDSDTRDPGWWDDVPRGDCNPLAASTCAMPFPSSYFLAEDAIQLSSVFREIAFRAVPIHVAK